MRIYTRGDLDGLTSTVLISLAEPVQSILFAHPKDMRDGLIVDLETVHLAGHPRRVGCPEHVGDRLLGHRWPVTSRSAP